MDKLFLKKTASKENLSGSLFINDYRVMAKIGVTKPERNTPQPLSISITFNFKELPKGAFNDNYADTNCYAEITLKIRTFVESREFNLVENLAYELYQLLWEAYHNEVEVQVKKMPAIENLQGGVIFSVKKLDL